MLLPLPPPQPSRREYSLLRYIVEMMVTGILIGGADLSTRETAPGEARHWP